VIFADTSWHNQNAKAQVRRHFLTLDNTRRHPPAGFDSQPLLQESPGQRVFSGQITNHARPATTLNVYAHFIAASDRAAADAMGKILAPPSREPSSR